MASLRKAFRDLTGITVLYPPPRAYAQLHDAIRDKDPVEKMAPVLQKYPDAVRWVNKARGDLLPLPYAIFCKNISAMRLLVMADATLLTEEKTESYSSRKMTPLQKEAYSGSTDMIDALIDCGADVHHVNSEGNQAIHFAAPLSFDDKLKALIRHGADVHAKNADGDAPLRLAAKGGSLQCFATLLPFDPDLEKTNSKGETYLMHAAASGRTDLVKFLCDNKTVAKDTTCNAGKTALDHALDNRQYGNAATLIKAGAPVDFDSDAFKEHLKVSLQRRDNSLQQAKDDMIQYRKMLADRAMHDAAEKEQQTIAGTIRTLRNGLETPLPVGKRLQLKPK